MMVGYLLVIHEYMVNPQEACIPSFVFVNFAKEKANVAVNNILHG